MAERGTRPNGRPLLIGVPAFGSWGWWAPWDSYGYGYGYGYGYPYGYGLGYGFSSRYGLGAFSRFGRYGYGYGYGSGEYGRAGRSEVRGRTGSIRLRVNPSTAQVYIDGALAGTVAEFNGLTTHLDVEAGTHQLEIRAAGYQTYQTRITVSVDKTITARATLKKK